MSSVNIVTLIGRVGKDPEAKKTDKSTVCNFTVATSETYKDKSGEKKESTEWHNIVAFGATAEIIEKYVKKGDQVYVTGKIKTDQYTDKDGNKKYATKIYADKIVMLGGKKSSDEKPSVKEPEVEPEPENDLPF